MTPIPSYDPASFKGLEQAGWDKTADVYDALLGSVTRNAIDPLLDATAVRPGSDVLELCCGPGYGAGAAAARGARGTGIDFAPGMVARARQLHPAATFETGDAEALAFDAGRFDAVICAFGIHHLEHPDAALREAHRVLRPGGRFAFTMWCAPERSKFHALILDSIRAHGTLDVPLPPAPPVFRFSDPAACIDALKAAAFGDVRVVEIPLAFHAREAADVLALTRCAVRMEMTIDLQVADVRDRIRRAIVEGAERLRVGDRIVVPMPALVASGVMLE